MRYAAKVDNNHGEIRDGLRDRGFVVSDFSHIGGGFPDLGVFLERETILLEVKTPKGKPTKAQKRFHALWKGRLYVVRSLVEALAVIGRSYADEHVRHPFEE